MQRTGAMSAAGIHRFMKRSVAEKGAHVGAE